MVSDFSLSRRTWIASSAPYTQRCAVAFSPPIMTQLMNFARTLSWKRGSGLSHTSSGRLK